MSKSMWIIITLISILAISSFWFGRNREIPPWMKCKESLFEQVVFNKCTSSSFDDSFERMDKNPDNNTLPYEAPQN